MNPEELEEFPHSPSQKKLFVCEDMMVNRKAYQLTRLIYSPTILSSRVYL